MGPNENGVSLRVSPLYQAIWEIGWQLGLEEARLEGAVRAVRRILLLQGKSLLGKPGAATRKALEVISDLNRLEAMCVRLLQAKSWQELLQEPGALPPRRREEP